MKAKVAVATVSGKTYYLAVRELKKKNVPFLSMTPNQRIPTEVRVVITSEKERPLIRHPRVLVLEDEMASEAVVNETMKIVQGDGAYQRIVVGVDPGEVFGLAVLGDDKIITRMNCYSAKETSHRIKGILEDLQTDGITPILVKIGDGAPDQKDELVRILRRELPSKIILQRVKEAGTNLSLVENKHKREESHMISAERIAGRKGQSITRREAAESNN